MKLQSPIFIVASIFLFAFSLIGNNLLAASDSADFWNDDFLASEKQPVKHWQLAFGSDFRTDEREHNSASPTFLADVLYYLNNTVAFNAGLGYNNRADFGNDYGIQSYYFDTGIRLQDQGNLFSPFFETGFQLAHYEINSNSGLSPDTRGGLFLAVGVSTKVASNYQIDLKLRHYINHIDDGAVYVTQPLPDSYSQGSDPPFPGFGPIRTTAFSQSLYNPTTIELQLRFPI